MLLPAPPGNALEAELEGVSRTTLSERVARPSIGKAEAAFTLRCRDGSCAFVNVAKRDPAAFKYANQRLGR